MTQQEKEATTCQVFLRNVVKTREVVCEKETRRVFYVSAGKQKTRKYFFFTLGLKERSSGLPAGLLLADDEKSGEPGLLDRRKRGPVITSL